MGSFTPLVFWPQRRNGERTASRMPVPYLFLKQSFEIFAIRPHICSLRGSRSPFNKDADFLDDFSVNAKNADIFH